MFERIRQHVDSYLAYRGQPPMNRSKVIFLDHSEGRVEGALQLIFGESSEYPLLIAKGAPQDRVRLRGGRSIYEVEFENLERLERLGMNEGGATTPRPLGLWRDDGLIVTLQAALPGELLKNIPGSELFSATSMDENLNGILAWWERFIRCFGIRREIVDEALYDERVIGQLTAFQRRFALSPDEGAFLERRLRDERRLLGLELPLMARHGDLCTANMARLAHGVGVFDWEFPLTHELPLFDVLHFFASLRYPFGGLSGESTHFESFVEVYWGDNRMNRALRRRLADVCERYAIPDVALGDLFLVSLIQIANLKYDGFTEIYGTSRADASLERPEDDVEVPWRRSGGRDKNAPFARIRDGVFENTRYVARNGLPDFSKPRGA